jgi:lincosamide nucleotidyltransferase A/C/D/E
MADLTAEPAMSAEAVTGLVDLLASHGVRVWLDGGWAVDACLGYQTRWHSDLDVVIEDRRLPDAVAVLRENGYWPVPQAGSCPWNFVLGDRDGHQVDIDVITFDASGNGIYGPAENGQRYPAAAFTGSGTINGRRVDCFSPEWLVVFHTGYQVDATDWADVSALCQRFGLPVPGDYARFRELAAGDQCNTNPTAAVSQERSLSARPAGQRLEGERHPPGRR